MRASTITRELFSTLNLRQSHTVFPVWRSPGFVLRYPAARSKKMLAESEAEPDQRSPRVVAFQPAAEQRSELSPRCEGLANLATIPSGAGSSPRRGDRITGNQRGSVLRISLSLRGSQNLVVIQYLRLQSLALFWLNFTAAPQLVRSCRTAKPLDPLHQPFCRRSRGGLIHHAIGQVAASSPECLPAGSLQRWPTAISIQHTALCPYGAELAVNLQTFRVAGASSFACTGNKGISNPAPLSQAGNPTRRTGRRAAAWDIAAASNRFSGLSLTLTIFHAPAMFAISSLRTAPLLRVRFPGSEGAPAEAETNSIHHCYRRTGFRWRGQLKHAPGSRRGSPASW
jgi:hypothetical protein